MTEYGPVDTLENANSEDDDTFCEKAKLKVPGSLKQDLSVRKSKPELNLYAVSCCPTGRSFVCVSTEGLLIYSKDEKYLFDPMDIDSEITRDSVIALLEDGKSEAALLSSVKIGEYDLICQCLLIWNFILHGVTRF
ncbi:hypothetical protein MXB_2582 [Myxobolus squamalis]|nr:hypothetical protein MXB_2582 [Myxobolus squamalis]